MEAKVLLSQLVSDPVCNEEGGTTVHQPAYVQERAKKTGWVRTQSKRSALTQSEHSVKKEGGRQAGRHRKKR